LNSSCSAPTSSSGASFPDVPVDLICSGSACPSSSTPASFFTAYRLVSVTTSVRAGGVTRHVDRISLTHEFPSTGEAGVSPKLWLRTIQRTGSPQAPMPLTLPPVRFDSFIALLKNRADGAPSAGVPHMFLHRVDSIKSEIGGQTVVTYGQPDPCSPIPVGTWDSNVKNCFPAWYAPPGGAAGFAVFNKYLALSVTERDLVGGSPDIVTAFGYSGGAAWRHPNDPLVPDSRESWSQWRGYGIVTERVGSGQAKTTTETRYHRGMHGDRLAGGGTKAVSVWDTSNTWTVDENWLAGRERQVRSLNALSTWEFENHILAYTTQITATSGSDAARLVRVGETTRFMAQSALGPKTSKTIVTHNSYGFPTTVRVLPDVNWPADWRCTETAYAVNTSAWITNAPVSVITHKSPSASVGADCSMASPWTSWTQYRYDGGGEGAAPSKGNITMTRRFEYTLQTWIDRWAEFDALGRPWRTTDALGRQMTTAFAPSTGYATAVTETNAAGHQTVSLIDPAWGVTTTTDPNGKSTRYVYDELGRLFAVHTADLYDSPVPAVVFRYTVSQTAPSTVKTQRLSDIVADALVWADEIVYVDGLGRPRETQRPNTIGGRTVTYTWYDDRGLTRATSAPFGWSGTIDAGIVAPSYSITNEQRYTYDDAERLATTETLVQNVVQTGRTVSTAWDGWRSVTSHPGVQSTTTDVDGSGNVWRTIRGTIGGTSYRSYDDHGRLISFTDPLGRQTIYDYDWLGRIRTTTDPNRGTTWVGYDAVGNIVSITDATGAVTWTDHDALNRPVRRRMGGPTGAITATWTYDTLRKGYLDSASTCSGNSTVACDTPYTSAITGYTERYEIAQQLITIPSAEIGLDNNGIPYAFEYVYDLGGRRRVVTNPSIVGSVRESVSTGVDPATGLATTLSTTGGAGPARTLVSGSVFNDRLMLTSRSYGAASVPVTRWFEHDLLGRTTGRFLQYVQNGAAAYVQADRYAFDDRDNVVKVANDVSFGRLCRQYDGLNRLVRAYTMYLTNTCTPPAGLQGDVVPYDHTYAYSVAGDLTVASEEQTNGSVVNRPYGYVSAHPSAPATVGADLYSYDAAGRQTSRTVNAVTTNLKWDHTVDQPCYFTTGATTNPCASPPAGSVSMVYDASGQRLIRRDPNGDATLYLPGIEITRRTSGSVETTTYHAIGTNTVGFRTPDGLYHWVAGDHHGSVTTTLHDTTTTSATQRYYPYGARRGGDSIGTTDRGFVGQTEDSTGLVYLNNRYYDPHIGVFISVDPLVSVTVEPYIYASGNPTTLSDPSGLSSTCLFCMAGGNYTDSGPLMAHLRPYELMWNSHTGEGPLPAHNRGCGWLCKVSEGFADTSVGFGTMLAHQGADALACLQRDCNFSSTRRVLDGLSHTITHPEDIVTDCIDVPWHCAGAALATALAAKATGLAARTRLPTRTTATEAVDIAGANFAQTTASRTFSSGGTFAGQSIDDVAGALRSGAMSAKDVPVLVIVRDGNTLILNTRSALALEQAGVPRSAWNVVNVTGDPAAQARLAGQLARNGLDSTGTSSVRITGAG
jgi:RHS repeat-associated protein